MRTPHILGEGTYPVIDVFGPSLEFLSPPEEDGAVYCVMKGVIPPGVTVPLHSHADAESFFVLSGSVQVLSDQQNGLEWRRAASGDFIHLPGHARHAFRNMSTEPVIQLLTTTPRLGRFFLEIGRPITPGVQLDPPTAKDLEHFAEIAASYGHWLATPAENKAIGIYLPDVE